MLTHSQRYEVLGEVTLYESQQVKLVQKYVKGIFPDMGKIHKGLSKNWETVKEVFTVKATKLFTVL